MAFPASVKLVEVGPRDGLQSIEKTISTEEKIQFINMLSSAGLPEIEVTSFVSPKWVPQLADAKDVSQQIERNEHITYTALVPNLKGLEGAVESGYQSVAVFTAASETFSQKNTNCSIDESIQRFEEMRPVWEMNNLRVRGYVSTCWVCPYEDFVSVEKVADVVQKLVDLGIQEISLGDTIGKAVPDSVEDVLESLLSDFSPSLFALHFHDTYGNALDNIRKGLEYGIAVYDSSAGGIGGCPYAPGASGNVGTEAVTALCAEENIVTGVDRVLLEEAGEFIQSITSEKEATAS